MAALLVEPEVWAPHHLLWSVHLVLLLRYIIVLLVCSSDSCGSRPR